MENLKVLFFEHVTIFTDMEIHRLMFLTCPTMYIAGMTPEVFSTINSNFIEDQLSESLIVNIDTSKFLSSYSLDIPLEPTDYFFLTLEQLQQFHSESPTNDYFIVNFRIKQLFINFIILLLNKNFISCIRGDETFDSAEYLSSIHKGHEFYNLFFNTEGFVRLLK